MQDHLTLLEQRGPSHHGPLPEVKCIHLLFFFPPTIYFFLPDTHSHTVLDLFGEGTDSVFTEDPGAVKERDGHLSIWEVQTELSLKALQRCEKDCDHARHSAWHWTWVQMPSD